jgi:hypothetical protein
VPQLALFFRKRRESSGKPLFSHKQPANLHELDCINGFSDGGRKAWKFRLAGGNKACWMTWIMKAGTSLCQASLFCVRCNALARSGAVQSSRRKWSDTRAFPRGIGRPEGPSSVVRAWRWLMDIRVFDKGELPSRRVIGPNSASHCFCHRARGPARAPIQKIFADAAATGGRCELTNDAVTGGTGVDICGLRKLAMLRDWVAGRGVAQRRRVFGAGAFRARTGRPGSMCRCHDRSRRIG